MSNPYFTNTFSPAFGSVAAGQSVKSVFKQIELGFDGLDASTTGIQGRVSLVETRLDDIESSAATLPSGGGSHSLLRANSSGGSAEHADVFAAPGQALRCNNGFRASSGDGYGAVFQGSSSGDFSISSQGPSQFGQFYSSGDQLHSNRGFFGLVGDGVFRPRLYAQSTASGAFTSIDALSTLGTSAEIALNASGGVIGISGRANQSYKATVNGTMLATGSVYAPAFVVTSDIALKENILPADDCGGLIDSMRVVSFDFKSGGPRVKHGFIAQHLHAIAPHTVSVGEEGRPWGVDNSKLVPMLVQEIQALRRRLEAAEQKLSSL